MPSMVRFPINSPSLCSNATLTMAAQVLPKSVQRSYPFIKILIKSRPSVNKAELLRKFPPYVTNDIIEILHNVVTGQLPIKSKQKQTLGKYKNQLVRLVNIRKHKQKQKYFHNQNGHFIGALLPILASVLGGILPSVL